MDSVSALLVRLFTQAPWAYLAWPVAAMILGTLLGTISASAAARLAVVPRTSGGILGIFTGPFVHANFAHLAANLPPFLVLGALVLRRHQAGFMGIAVAIALSEGLLVWLFGRRGPHLGMSGVIFGFLGYLLTLAWLTRATPDLLAALVVLIVYGGMLAGMAPARKGISWESHLFGFVAGLGVAWLGSSV